MLHIDEHFPLPFYFTCKHLPETKKKQTLYNKTKKIANTKTNNVHNIQVKSKYIGI